MANSTSTAEHLSDEEFDVVANGSPDLNTTLDRLKEFSFYLVENVELNLNLCLSLLEERDVDSKPNSIYTTAFSKLLLAVPKVGSALGNALAKGEVVVFDKIDKKNSRILADLVYRFSDHKEEVRKILIEACIDVFFSFEDQFMQLTCKGGPKRAMHKLAKDASDRIFNYFLETNQSKDITRTEVTKGVLLGDSKRNKKGIKEGKTVEKGEVNWKTCKLYRKVGIVLVEEGIFFKNEHCKTEKYGHRRMFPWENIEDIKGAWELESGFAVPKYTITSKEDLPKLVRDYIMTKNSREEAQLERENYSKQAMEDRNLKHQELLETFQEHFGELLKELDEQYKVLLDNHEENKNLVVDISRNQEEDKLFHAEISTRLEEIKRHINDTKVLIERTEVTRKEIVQQEASGTSSLLTVEKVREIAKEVTNKNVEKQIVEVVKEKLRKNDPGPRIHREINRNLKKLKPKW